MSKDKISRVQARATPYIAPRRPLHAENGTFASRSVRQANPACSLPQYLPAGGRYWEDCNEYIGTVECVPAFRAFYVQSSGNDASSNAKYFTCAKIACDYDSPNIQKADRIQSVVGGYVSSRPNDTRCFISIPPKEITHPPIGGKFSSMYRNIPGTVAYDMDSIANTGGTYIAGVVHDVDNSMCYQGFNNPAIAREIQQEIGITAALGTAAAAACLVPAQTAAIAAATQATAVTGLAVGLGLLGSGVVIGGAAYAGYRFVQHFKTPSQVAPDTEENHYEAIDLNRIDLNEHLIVSPEKVLESPFERPFAD